MIITEHHTGVVGGIYGGVQPGGGGRSAGSLTGVHGSIKWQYYTAAAIEGYTVTRANDGQLRLTANVVLSDAFKMAQTPLTFVAMYTKKGLDGTCVVKTACRFLILSHTLVEHSLTARLGPPQED